MFIREIDERIIFAILNALRKRCRNFRERNRRLEERLDGLESEECVGLDCEGLVEVRVGSASGEDTPPESGNCRVATLQ